MNSFTKKQYDALKRDRSFTVINFDLETGKRLGTYSSLTIVEAMREVMVKQFRTSVMVLRDLPEEHMTMQFRHDYVLLYRDAAQYLELPERGS